MASRAPLSPGAKLAFTLPMPPPPLHVRSGNETESPHTPTQQAFTSPTQTPQGSPSKNRMPPGSNAIPDVFDNAFKLQAAQFPSSTNVGPHSQTSAPTSPIKGFVPIAEDPFVGVDESIIHTETSHTPGSPTRRSNKENTPPGSKVAKEIVSPQSQAAASRREPYSPREEAPVARKGYEAQRGLTVEELEKLQKPQVKRLANVTQLCK